MPPTKIIVRIARITWSFEIFLASRERWVNACYAY
jgi:hypothetical protein